MIESVGETRRMSGGDQYFLKLLGERMPGISGKVSLVAHCIGADQSTGKPGKLGLAWNDGTGDAYKDWTDVPAHLKLTKNGQDEIDFG